MLCDWRAETKRYSTVELRPPRCWDDALREGTWEGGISAAYRKNVAHFGEAEEELEHNSR
jgi:hypothetical protein